MENNKKIGRPTIGIVTDGLHIKKEKMTHYKAVNLATGEEIFNRTVGNQTTCIGRFIAIVEAAKYIFRTAGAPRIIYSIVRLQYSGTIRSRLTQSGGAARCK